MRRLGQHFLKDKRVLERIANILEIKPTNTIIEIGPGHGELTKYLLDKSPKKIIAVEKDENLALEIKNQKLGDGVLEIIEGDILKILPDIIKTHNLKSGSYKIVGNIPYYITGKLLRTLGELEQKPEQIVLTIQKEVAERITAEPPKMNLLSASVKYWGTPEIIRFISKKAFRPQPKIESAIISIKPHKKAPTTTESKTYYAIMKILFKQPRKTISNNLKNGTNLTKKEVETLLLSLRIEPNLRPQNLSIDTINNLSHNIALNRL